VRIATLKESARRARNGLPMISSEVQRTLVKSPPELWAELSDPAALARHLGELGELGGIRITRIEPEKTVEWEAADTTGKVLLKPSGWGTKVTLTAIRELSAPEPPLEPEPSMEVEPEPEPESVAVEEPEPGVVLEEPKPRSPGFFARLFRRRIKDQALPEPAVELDLTVEPEPAPEDVTPPQDALPDETPDIAAELKAAEEKVAAEEVTAVLTAVLDRLGAAHHRPFSRA
jgi:hypothetical protein